MRRTAPVFAFVVAAALALTATVAVSPSYAVTAPRALPAGQTLYSISCNSDQAEAQLARLDAGTGAGTLVGSGTTSGGRCAYQPTWDAATQKAYFVDGDNSKLRVMDITTGVSTLVGAFALGEVPQSVDAIAISATGVAYAIHEGTLYLVNLDTAVLTLVGSDDGTRTWALAFSPAGTLYGLDDPYDETPANLYTIDTTNGHQTPVTTLSLPKPSDSQTDYNNPGSMQFDSTGILWLENDFETSSNISQPSAGLWSVDISVPASASASAVFQGALKTGDSYYYTEALLIVPFAVPVFTSAAEATGTVGSAFTFTVTATGPNAPTFAVTTGALPAGLTLNPTTGGITGTPTAVGTSAFTITATNRMGSTPQSFTLNIAADASIHLPVVSG